MMPNNLSPLLPSTLQRVLEPEVMDTLEEAVDYDAMDFVEVNGAFSEAALALVPPQPLAEHRATPRQVLDAGTGTARIPILINQRQQRLSQPLWQITAIDLAANMLKIGAEHVARAGLTQTIQLAQVDVKNLPYADASFDLVISNSIVHHLPDPLPFFKELRRVLKPGGGFLLRDLLRPNTEAEVQALVAQIGPEYNDHQQQLFGDSLRAAFTLPEIQALFEAAGLARAGEDLINPTVRIYASSERHWTAARPCNF
jgi:ubiquinone/menaquinone biosynthesis C-methylase UbiE